MLSLSYGVNAMKGDKEAMRQVTDMIDQIDVDPLTKAVAKTATALGGNPVPILVMGMAMKMTAEAEAKNPKPEVPEDYDKTERVIAEMLWENTGCHPLDSGFYGRHWERNRQIKDFKKTPVVIVDEDYVLINVFHYLCAFLERDEISEKLEERFYKFAERPENIDQSWISLMIDFAERLKDEGWRFISMDNSANWDNYLSQEIQFMMIEHEEHGQYLFLQIHNGADLRGGYTKPRVFRLVEPNDGDFFCLMDELYAECGCTFANLEPGYCEAYVNGGDDQIDGFPEYWVWDESIRSYKCNRCGKAVEFHHIIEDGF
jgi:hypothetical protein